MLFAYHRLGLLIEGMPPEHVPVSPAIFLIKLHECAPSDKELVFLRRLCRRHNAGALLAVVGVYQRRMLDDDGAHNARVLANCDMLARSYRRLTDGNT